AIVDGVPLHGAPGDGAKASLMLRPERLSLARAAVPAGLAVTVRDITFLGNNIEVSTETSTGTDLAVRLPFGHEAISSLARGDRAWLTFDTASAHAFA
uniref:TOBE domain-containing protein n=1 Tax=Shinella sp. BYT-45 TaxID=3377377 RepID=UPI003980DC1E